MLLLPDTTWMLTSLTIFPIIFVSLKIIFLLTEEYKFTFVKLALGLGYIEIVFKLEISEIFV